MWIKLKIRFIYLMRAIKNCRKMHLGEIVFINGKKYFINNGVKFRGPDILYDCLRADRTPVLKRRHIEATRHEMERKLFAWVGSIKHRYNFYMVYWYRIDVRRGKPTKVV